MTYIIGILLAVFLFIFFFGFKRNIVISETGEGTSKSVGPVESIESVEVDLDIPEPAKLTKADLDLSAAVKLRFFKNEYNKYEVAFLNPLRDRYWVLPQIKARIHKKWDFDKLGSYGAYEGYKYAVHYEDIEGIKRTFVTLKDIDDYFKACRERYKSFHKHQAEIDKLPNVID